MDCVAAWEVRSCAGIADLSAGQPEQAIREFTLAVSLAPRQKRLHERQADAIWTAGSMREAAPYYEAELAIDPESPSTLLKLGGLNVLRANPDAAIPLLQHALRLDPTLTVARYYLGRADATVGLHDEAIANLQIAAQDQEDEATAVMAWYQLAMIYRRAKQTEEATRALDNFRAIRTRRNNKMAIRTMALSDWNRQLPHPALSPMQSPL